MFDRFTLTAAVALTLAACGITGKDISVAEFEAHMDKSFSEVGYRQKLSGADVIVIGESKERERDIVEWAVKTLNAGLPACARLTMAPARNELSFHHLITKECILPGKAIATPNTIYVEFISDAKYCRKDRPAAGSSWGRYIQIIRDTWNYKDDRKIKGTMTHELVHSLGVVGHVPNDVRSLMTAGYGVRYHIPGLLSKSDKAVLAHLYPCKG